MNLGLSLYILDAVNKLLGVTIALSAILFLLLFVVFLCMLIEYVEQGTINNKTFNQGLISIRKLKLMPIALVFVISCMLFSILPNKSDYLEYVAYYYGHEVLTSDDAKNIGSKILELANEKIDSELHKIKAIENEVE